MEKVQCEMKGEREIPASVARSLLCQGMLIDIVYVASSEDHFGSMREREREKEREREFSRATETFYQEWIRAYKQRCGAYL